MASEICVAFVLRSPPLATIFRICASSLFTLSLMHFSCQVSLVSELPNWCAAKISIRKRFCVNSRNQLQRIFVVNLLQGVVRHLKAVNAPERVALAVVLEIFVARFERPEIP